MSNETVGERIRETREAAGISRESLAEALDVTLSTVSRIETGKIPISIDRLDTIATALGVAAPDLLPKPRRRKSA